MVPNLKKSKKYRKIAEFDRTAEIIYTCKKYK